jgi:hypothetical protein
MASLPLRFIPVGALLGDQEDIPSLSLPSVYSSGGSQNFWIDEFGRAAQILGYLKQNPAAITTNTGAHATLLRGLAHYALQAAGVTTRHEIGVFDDGTAHWEIRISTDAGVTWTFKEDLGAGSITTIPDFAQMGNIAIITNGVMVPRQWDGVNESAISNTRLAAPTLAVSGAGNLNGNYFVRIVPIKTDGSRKVASVQSLVLALANNAMDSTWVADADLNVAAYEVYRTTGTDLTFLYEGTVVGRLVVTYHHNTSDADLLANRALQEYGDAPPTGVYFVEIHKQRAWYGRTDASPRTWWFSDAGLYGSVYTGSNFLDMTDAESRSDVATGGTGNFQGMFVAWLERSVWTVSGTGQVSGAVIDWQRRRSNAQIGTVSHRTVARIPRGAKYVNAEGAIITTDQVTLAYFTPFADVRLFDGDNDTVISGAKATTLARLTYEFRRKAICIEDTSRSEVTWLYPADGATENTLGVTWNYKFGVWYERDWTFACGVQAEASTMASLILTGESKTAAGGFCYQLWTGITNNGVQIAARLMTKTFYGLGEYLKEPSLSGSPLMSYQKRWRWVEFLIRNVDALTLKVEWLATEAQDNGAPVGSTTFTIPGLTSVLEAADGTVIHDADGNSIIVSADAGVTIVRVPIIDGDPNSDNYGQYMHTRGIRFRITTVALISEWMLMGMLIAYQVMPGLRRDFQS